MDYFRFEKMDIWKDAIDISDKLFDYSDKAEDKKFFKFAEQLRSAGMSISNNIAEGSGSFSARNLPTSLIYHADQFLSAQISFIFF